MANWRPGLAVAIIAVVALRLAVQLAMPQPVVSDSLAYLTMAQSLSHGGPMRDMFGNAAFYSPGYPMLLAPALWLGIPPLVVNLALSALTAWLIFTLAHRLSGDTRPALLAVAGYAVWLPSLLAASTLAKENLSTPLLLGFVIATLDVAAGKRPVRAAAVAGACYGAGLLAGASSLLVVAALGVALAFRWWRGAGRVAPSGAVFALALLMTVGPWLLHTDRLFGHPVLTTNSGFNLYLGNNPAATGDFVSIADTPLGSQWHAMREQLGEDGSAAVLETAARAYMRDNPRQTASLALTKLARFWAPNVPDAADRVQGAIGIVRWIDVVQHTRILALAVAGLWQLRRVPGALLVTIALGAFWAVHAVTYVMVRYREPIMPILIVLAALAVWNLVLRRKMAT